MNHSKYTLEKAITGDHRQSKQQLLVITAITPHAGTAQIYYR